MNRKIYKILISTLLIGLSFYQFYESFIGNGVFYLFLSLLFILTYFKNEFIRYGIPNFRKITGFFQLLGGSSLLIGIYIDELTRISSLGLTILMFMGVGVD